MRMKKLFLLEFLSNPYTLKRHKSTVTLDGSDFQVIAIHSSQAPYFVAWCLFDTFSLEFVCEKEPFTINLSKEKESHHLEYFFKGSEQWPRMWLIQNQGTQGKLVKAKPSPDYLLLFEKDFGMLNVEQWFNKLKSSNKFELVYQLQDEQTSKWKWVSLLKHLIIVKEQNAQTEI